MEQKSFHKHLITLRVKVFKIMIRSFFAKSDSCLMIFDLWITLIAFINSEMNRHLSIKNCIFFEFLFDVYREKIILGIPIMETRDANIFFNNKEVQSAEVEAWKDTTKRKLRSCYFNFMVDANLLAPDGKTRRITPPILDIALERHLEAKGDSAMIKAITGVSWCFHWNNA